jgi:hypothetical protein
MFHVQVILKKRRELFSFDCFFSRWWMDYMDKLVELFIKLFRWYTSTNKVFYDLIIEERYIYILIYRNCTNPSPANNGAPCVGTSYDYQTCNDAIPCVICMFWKLFFFCATKISVLFFPSITVITGNPSRCFSNEKYLWLMFLFVH